MAKKKPKPLSERSEGILRRQCLNNLIDLVEKTLPVIREEHNRRIRDFQCVDRSGTWERDMYGNTKERYETDKKYALSSAKDDLNRFRKCLSEKEYPYIDHRTSRKQFEELVHGYALFYPVEPSQGEKAKGNTQAFEVIRSLLVYNRELTSKQESRQRAEREEERWKRRLKEDW